MPDNLVKINYRALAWTWVFEIRLDNAIAAVHFTISNFMRCGEVVGYHQTFKSHEPALRPNQL